MTQALKKKLELMDGPRIARTLARIAHEVLERHADPKELVLVGVRSRGVPLAHRLAREIAMAAGAEPQVGALDISLYRDDFTSIAAQPLTKGTEIPFSIDGRIVVVVDDVLFTGRTVRAALDQLIDFGRPARIELAVLVDRGHRELPIRADYAGKTVATAHDEVVQVRVLEEDGVDSVELLQRAESRRAATPAGRGRAKRTGRAKRKGASASRTRKGSGARDRRTARPKARR